MVTRAKRTIRRRRASKLVGGRVNTRIAKMTNVMKGGMVAMTHSEGSGPSHIDTGPQEAGSERIRTVRTTRTAGLAGKTAQGKFGRKR